MVTRQNAGMPSPETSREKPRVAFFGRSDEYLSIEGLHILLGHRDRVDIVSVTCGRGKETSEGDGTLHRIAREHDLPLHDFADVKTLVDPLDLVLSFSNPVVFPASFIDRVPAGIINMHPAPLPRYRGSHGLEYAILEGADRFGVTLHYCDAGIDTGPVIEIGWLPIGAHDTSRALWPRIDEVALELLRRHLPAAIDGAAEGRRLPTVPQDEADAVWYPDGSLPEECELDVSLPYDEFLRYVRAYDHPRREGAYLRTARGIARLRMSGADAVIASIEPSP